MVKGYLAVAIETQKKGGNTFEKDSLFAIKIFRETWNSEIQGMKKLSMRYKENLS